MKRTFAKVALAIIFCTAFAMLTAEAQTAFLQVLTTSGTLAAMALSAKGLERLGAFGELKEEEEEV